MVAQINNQGVQDLFSDILFPADDDDDDVDDNDVAAAEYQAHIQRLLDESSKILEPSSFSTHQTSSNDASNSHQLDRGHHLDVKPALRRLLNSAPDGAERYTGCFPEREAPEVKIKNEENFIQIFCGNVHFHLKSGLFCQIC